jgi:DNA-binding winged helix-turn-helix (wHTH) protein
LDRLRFAHAAQIDLAEHSTFRIGRLLVQPVAREVRFDRKSQRLEPQPMKVLIALVQNEGNVVTRDELIWSCWDGRIVGEDVINRAILMLRRIAKASGAFEIVTVRGSGYRLTQTEQPWWRNRWYAWSAVVAAAVAGLAFLLLRPGPNQSHPPMAVIELHSFAASGDRLAADSAKASDAVVADMLANSGLPVLQPGRRSVQGRSAQLRLSGRMQVVGNTVEANLQLDDLAHGTLLLSRRFSVRREDVGSLPDQIGAFAATALASTGALMALDSRHPGDARLTGELLRQWSMMIVFEDAASTYQAANRIAPRMPNSAVAQLGLAMTTVHMLPVLAPEDRPAALQKGRVAATRARQLAPDYGDVAWPDCGLYSPVRMSHCEAVLRKAFAIDPGAPFVAAGLRNQLVEVGRFRDALDYDRLAVAAMPYMAGRLSASTLLLEGVGMRARARQQFARVRRWWPEFDRVFADRIEGMLDRGSIEDAAAFVASMPSDVDVIDRQAVASIAGDVAAKRRQPVRSRCLSTTADDRLAYFCLVALIRVGDIDGAFVLADRLFPTLIADDPKEEDRLFLERPLELGLGVLSTPALAPLRQDPRFIPIAKRVGLIRYWSQTHLPDFCTLAHEPVCPLLGRPDPSAASRTRH